jgi:hypothetical protein
LKHHQNKQTNILHGTLCTSTGIYYYSLNCSLSIVVQEKKKRKTIPVQSQELINSLDTSVDHNNPVNDSPILKKRKLRSNTSIEDLEPKANNI